MIRLNNRLRSAFRPVTLVDSQRMEDGAPSAPSAPSAPDEPSVLLELLDLEVGYAEQRVAEPITLTLRAGEALAVIGANGAGKSTLLRTVAGLQPALAGSALLHARLIDEREASYRAAVDRELDFFGLSAGADALPLSLSSGQRRRMLLAAAFVRPAELLILDEPEQRLDRGMRARLAERMRLHTASGTAVLFATHDPDFVRTAAGAALLVGDPSQHLTPAAGVAAIGAL